MLILLPLSTALPSIFPLFLLHPSPPPPPPSAPPVPPPRSTPNHPPQYPSPVPSPRRNSDQIVGNRSTLASMLYVHNYTLTTTYRIARTFRFLRAIHYINCVGGGQFLELKDHQSAKKYRQMKRSPNFFSASTDLQSYCFSTFF